MDRLAIWGVGRDRAITRIEFGSVPRRSSGDVQFRVRNQSVHYTAVAATVSVDGADAEQFYLSRDGVSFAAGVVLGDLPAAAVSPVLTLRRITPSTDATGAHTCVLRVTAESWQPADAPVPAAAPLPA